MPDDDALTNHFFWRPGWRPGRAYLTWHVLPDDAVAHAVRPVQDALRSLDHLAVVRPERLHVTGPGVGFLDEIGPRTVPGLVQAATDRLGHLEPFTASAERLVVGRNAVLLTMASEGLSAVRRALRAAVRDTGLEPPGTDDEPYRPHLTLAYATGPAARSTVESACSTVDVRDLPPLRVTAASLLALVMEPAGYEWSVCADALLGDAAQDGRRSLGAGARTP